MASGVLYLAGAIGVEMSTDWYAEEDPLNTLAYNLWTAVEEGLEMGSIVLFIYAVLDYMGRGQDINVNVILNE